MPGSGSLAPLEPTTATSRRWFRVTGWYLLHRTRMAFEGVAIFAVLMAAASEV